jgi:hypothetical protein
MARALWLVAVVGLLSVGAAEAQTPPQPQAQARPKPPTKKGPPKWTFEIVGGGIFGKPSSGGNAGNPFPVGDTFMTEAGLPSRSVSSWYFGDGATLFSQVQAQFATRFGLSFPTVTSIDEVLRSAGVERRPGGSFGFRVGRALTKRFAFEFGFERSLRPLELTGRASAAIEKSRASFIDAFNGLLTTIPQSGGRVSSAADVYKPPNGQNMITGSVIISLLTRGRMSAHAVAGAGTVTSKGSGLDVRLRGSYQFSIFGTFPVNETDTTMVHFAGRKRATVGVFGGGFGFALSPRHVLHVDLRALVGQTGQTTSVDATPASVIASAAAFLPSLTTPSLQFSTASTIRSSLNGALATIRTFTSSGLESQISATIGMAFKF